MERWPSNSSVRKHVARTLGFWLRGIQVLDVLTCTGLSVLRVTLKYCYYHDLWLNTWHDMTRKYIMGMAYMKNYYSVSPLLESQSFVGIIEAGWSLLSRISIGSSLLTQLWRPTWSGNLCKASDVHYFCIISFKIKENIIEISLKDVSKLLLIRSPFPKTSQTFLAPYLVSVTYALRFKK